jgi:RND superfamily putative drug exporter
MPVGARRPRLTIAVAVLVLACLAAIGSGVDGRLQATSLNVPGTESSRGAEMLREHFGQSAPFAILLQGPPRALDRQGRRLTLLLRRDRRATVISPWDHARGAETLRPDPRTAVELVDFHVSVETAMDVTAPRLERLLDRSVRAPVRARDAGFATVSRAIREESLDATRRGELILAPILLLILLIVFRSPVAAIIPLIFGGVTMVAARGLIALLAGYVDISGFALSIGTMIGLAVGVDYALLIVSRFREELDAGLDPPHAAAATRRTAGRTTAFAGGVLLLAVLVAVVLVPGALLLSLCATVAPAILVAVAGPFFVGPAVLTLLGHNVNRWRIGRRGAVRTRWLAISRAALRRPALTVVAVSLLMVAIAIPATSLATGPVTIEELSRDDPARLDVEAIETAVGGGWVTPAVVVAVNEDGPITGHRQLAALSRWQARVARQPRVEEVIGPGVLAGQATELRRTGRRFLADDPRPGDPVSTLRQARRGLAELRRGLARARAGASRLAHGGGRAAAGSGTIARGLHAIVDGAARARGAIGRFRRGVHRLASGQSTAALGASLLAFGVQELRYEAKGLALAGVKRLRKRLAGGAAEVPTAEAAAKKALRRLETAWAELGAMTVGTGDPHYAATAAAVREALTAVAGRDPVDSAPYAAGYEGLPKTLAQLGAAERASLAEAGELSELLARMSTTIGELGKLGGRLRRGVAKLEHGTERLAGGSDRMIAVTLRLNDGLERLAAGAGRLAGGLALLRKGQARLAQGLESGSRRSRPLAADARRTEGKVLSARHRLDRTSPRIFDSGYFMLSALDGAPPRRRQEIDQELDLGGGGQAAKILVIDTMGGRSPLQMSAENERLRASARALAAAGHLKVAVTGGIAQSVDYQRATSARLLPLVVAITAITFVVMVMILRALPLAAIAITLNLLAVAAAFGVLSLLTRLPADLPFGGAGHVDPVSAAGIFGVVFGLSIDYAIFLLMRMREGWEREGDADAAIVYGLERTAAVITGSATIMTVVFMIFATTPIQSVAQFGVSLTVAVVLDATVVRLMLVPTLMKLIGPRIWWMPAWLERCLPRLNVEGTSSAGAGGA